MSDTANDMTCAVVFDMDGLLLDSERTSMACGMEAADELGHVIPEELFLSVIGRDIRTTEEIFTNALGPDFSFPTFKRAWGKYQDARTAVEGVPIKLGSCELLNMLGRRGIPMALATSTHRSEAIDRMRTARLLEHFQVIVSGDEVEHGKPAPEIFLYASERLKVTPRDCIVLEDSEPGVIGAHAAGMLTLLVPDLQRPSDHVRGLANHIFDSLPEAQGFLETLLPKLMSSP